MRRNINKIVPAPTKAENLEPIITGKEALELSGIQNDLAHQLVEQAGLFGTMLTLRVSSLSNLPPYNSPGVPKPSSIHSKTTRSAWGRVPKDWVLTKVSKDGTPSGHHPGDKVKQQEFTQLKLTLYEVLERCGKNGDLQVEFKNPATLIFKFKPGKAPRIPRLSIFKYINKEFKGEFRINLDDAQAQKVQRFFPRLSDSPKADSFLMPERLEEILKESPDNARLHSKLAIDLLDKEYPIFYKQNSKDPDSKAEPFLVFAINGKPIIGDWDKDFESIPVNTMVGKIISSIENFNFPFNTFNGKEEQDKLLEATKSLFNSLCDHFNNKLAPDSPAIKKFFSDKNKFLELLDDSLLKRAGVITPYEFLKNMISNYCYQIGSTQKGYFDNPFQHGPDNRSPYEPSPDGPRLHIYNGEFIYTKNEAQQINLYLNDLDNGEFLKNNFIHVHPLVNMKNWRHVIEKQIEFGQGNLIASETIKAYFKYIKAHDIRPVVNVKQWRSVITTQIDNKQQRFIPKYIMEMYENINPSSPKFTPLFSTSLLSPRKDNSPRKDSYKKK